MARIEEMIKELPPELQQEVEDFVAFLLTKRVRQPARAFSLNWRGTLQQERKQHTSVELQHKLLDNWGN